MLRSTALITLALAFATPAAAQSPVVRASVDGREIQYTTREDGKKNVIIEGEFTGGERFRFTVKPSGYVKGEVGSTPVAFAVSRAQQEKLARSVTKRPQTAAATFSDGVN
jgi:hypothetical protein